MSPSVQEGFPTPGRLIFRIHGSASIRRRRVLGSWAEMSAGRSVLKETLLLVGSGCG